MTQEEKQLLLTDLSARLPYGVKVLIPECRKDIATLIGIDDICFAVKYGESNFYCPFHISIKPYLRQMSSMTEEEKEEYCNLQDKFLCSSQYPVTDAYELFDWLNKNHFDYRGLIQKGLAIEVTEENNPYKE